MKMFYSKLCGLFIELRPAKYQHTEKGPVEVEPRKWFRFWPTGEERGNVKFGQLATEDPEVIAYCEARVDTGGEIISEKEYIRLTRDPQEVISEKETIIAQLQRRLEAAEKITNRQQARP